MVNNSKYFIITLLRIGGNVYEEKYIVESFVSK